LEKGEVQISDQERAVQLESTLREVASMVSEKCINPMNGRPYTMAQIRDAMKTAGFMVHPTRNVKQQFLDCVRLLQEKKVITIERAKMLLALVLLHAEGDDNYPERRAAAVGLLIEAGVEPGHIKSPNQDSNHRVIFQASPSLYRQVEAIARDSTVSGRLEIIQWCISDEGGAALGSDLECRAQQQHEHTHQTQLQKVESTEGKQDNPPLDINLALSKQLQSNLNVTDKKVTEHATSSSGQMTNSRKAQKAAQKKSKKAKRREKEEQAEREERIAAEKERQRDRADRLGLVEDMPGNEQSESAIVRSGDAKPCNTCGGNFAAGEYRAHFRSDWHKYYVKLKM
jgi:hypothetical protein